MTIANDSGSTRAVWMSEQVPSFDEQIAEERERSLTDMRAALSLAETLLRVEPSPEADPDATSTPGHEPPSGA